MMRLNFRRKFWVPLAGRRLMIAGLCFCIAELSFSIAGLSFSIAGFGLITDSGWVWANEGDLHRLGRVSFSLEKVRDERAISDAIEDVAGLLQAVELKAPSTQVTEKRVLPPLPGFGRGPRLQFTATRKVLGPIALSFKIRGEAFLEPSECLRENAISGYQLRLDLSESEEAVRVNAAELRLKICVLRVGTDSYQAEFEGALIEGEDFGKIAGPMTRDILKSQIRPLQEAFIKQVRKHSQ